MAKWGEGDPRWIVEERADATNVNNWHWTEKNATPWSKDKLKSLLEGLVMEDDKYRCQIMEVSKVDGEASANNRKAKLFFFYEWELKANWTGSVKNGESADKQLKGGIEIPNLSEEHKPQDVDINVTVTGDSDAAYAVKEFVRTQGIHKIREQLGRYIADLKREFSQGMILPAKDSAADLTKLDQENVKKTSAAKNVLATPVSSKRCDQPLGVKINCKSLTETEEFKCSVDELFRALTNKEMVRAFTQSMAEMEAVKGGRFSLFNGNVTGEFTHLITNRKVEMRWRFKTWPDEHYSIVSIELMQKDDGTELRLSQTGIPASEYERTREGWHNYYWKSIKQTFGYGAFIY